MPQSPAEITISPSRAVATLLDVGQIVSQSHASPENLSSDNLSSIVTDSRKAQSGSIFIAFKGVKHDAHDNLNEVLQQSPSLLVVESSNSIPKNCLLPFVVVKNGRAAWSYLCAAAVGNPEKNLRIIGVTGTNGKTSTVWHLRHLFKQVNQTVLSLGTLGAWLGEEFIPTTHTTPDPPFLYQIFRRAVEQNISTVVMEVSSHAIYQEKLAPVKFAASVFTSFSRDHLDLHQDMESYFQEKFRLFTALTRANAPIYLSGSLGEYLSKFSGFRKEALIYGFDAQNAAAKFGFNHYRDLKLIATTNQGSTCALTNESDDAPHTIDAPIVGDFALENLLAAALVIKDSNRVKLTDLDFSKLIQVPGRLELVPGPKDKAMIIVDYAHTPDALEKALQTLRSLTRAKTWVVFGCGGDRDRGKRPLMGAVAAKFADRIIVTSDNPRFEEPTQIIADIIEGIPAKDRSKLTTQTDRSLAISESIISASSADIILIAGKGPEDYLDVRGVKYPFDDRNCALAALRGKHDC